LRKSRTRMRVIQSQKLNFVK